MLNQAGGTRAYVLGLGRALARQGHAITFIGAGPPASLEFADFVSVNSALPLSNYRFIRSLWSWVRDHHLAAGSVINAMRPDDLYPFLSYGHECLLVCTLHGNPMRGVAQRRLLGRWLYRHAEGKSLRFSQRVISVSGVALAEYVERYPKLRDKSCVVPVGLDLSTFRPVDPRSARRDLGLDDVPTLLFAGRLAPEKRVDVLVRAAKELPDGPAVVIAGGGPQEAKLRTMARNLRVRFLGTIKHDLMPKVLSAADAVVLPSAFEGLPTVALEALACGTPVLATPVGDLPQVVVSGQTGFFFDGSVKGLQALVSTHMSSLSSMRASCVKAASGFGWESIAKRVAEVYGYAG